MKTRQRQKADQVVLVIGSGGREVSIRRKIKRSLSVRRVLVTPGNGEVPYRDRRGVKATDIEGLMSLIKQERITFVVPGPEAALMAGIVDRCRAEGIACFGPTKQAAYLTEGSKVEAKKMMQAAGIPTAPFSVISGHEEGSAIFAHRFSGGPAYFKVDGLCGGKGAIRVGNATELDVALSRTFKDREFGDEGNRALLEELLYGREVSAFILTDGVNARWLGDAVDYKRLRDGNLGPNTGSMGSYSPSWLTEGDRIRIMSDIVVPWLRALAKAGTPYTGVLYVGLMMTKTGPYVLEFNARFGDPECQVLMAMLIDDLYRLLQATTVENGLKDQAPVKHSKGYAVCTVVAAPGYPEAPQLGSLIYNIGGAEAKGAEVIHAGTESTPHGGFKVSGGRVVGVVAKDKELSKAAEKSRDGAKQIKFPGAQMREDIAQDALV